MPDVPESRRSDSLEALLARIAETAGEADHVSLRLVLEAMGRRSFGSVLLVAGLITLAPLIGDIPGVPTIMGVLVVLTAGQMLFGRDQLWLPDTLLDRSVSREKVDAAVRWFRPATRIVDRVIGPRLEVVLRSGGGRAIAVACLLIGGVMPVLEVIPFSATVAGILLTLLSLALVTRDGLLALVTLIMAAVGGGVLAFTLS